jgi:formylglycine-generating enzyme required for sulfatase activity
MAQIVTGVYAEQHGNVLHIHYHLETESPCEVSLYVSLDGCKAYTGPKLHVSGNVGKNIIGGSHTIQWDVLAEQEQLVGTNICFKVLANSKKSFEPEMVWVDGGTFSMGSISGKDDEKPLHTVQLSSYWIGKYEITQEQWIGVMGKNPSYFTNCVQCPVENVSWNDAQEFILKLNHQTGKKYRLPTEAEWEFAARGGNKSKEYVYSGSNDLEKVAWYDANSERKTHSHGIKLSNELGIYDMAGNVWEWCSDWYGPYYFGASNDPKGPSTGVIRVYRGGSWDYDLAMARSSFRNGNGPDNWIMDLGFRVVLSTVQ